ncbi:MAG: sulfite exporter TauE/SafE family protein, partial [Betaproteobacteria bacterium]|nr:sulfite exporter TauE/SafE family protein [Betaproteobacteria bacterium]
MRGTPPSTILTELIAAIPVEIPWLTITGLLLLGACTGFLSGLLGIGGGMIMVPFVDAMLRQQGIAAEHSLRMAIATSLSTVLFTAVSSMRAHHRRAGVRWDVAFKMMPGMLAGSALGAVWASQLRTRWLLAWFAAFLLLSATQMLLERKPKPSQALPSGLGLSAAGTVVGALSSIVGAGGAFMTVPYLSWCSLAPAIAIGTSAASGFPIAAAGSLAYVISGWDLDLPHAIGYVYGEFDRTTMMVDPPSQDRDDYTCL